MSTKKELQAQLDAMQATLEKLQTSINTQGSGVGEMMSFITPMQYASREGIALMTVYKRLWNGTIQGTKIFGRWALAADVKPVRRSKFGRKFKSMDLAA